MGLFNRLLHREEPEDMPCPRCGIPAPPGAEDCAACGWDLHDAYHSKFTGSHLVEDEPAREEEPARET